MISTNRKEETTNVGNIYTSQGSKTKGDSNNKIKRQKIMIAICTILALLLIAATIIFYIMPPTIKNIEITNYDPETDDVTITITTRALFGTPECYLSQYETKEFNNKEHTVSSEKKCTFKTKLKDYSIYLQKVGTDNKSRYQLSKYYGNNIAITTDVEKLYLAVDQEDSITARLITLQDMDEVLTWEIDDPSVATVYYGYVKALKKGNTTIRIKAQDGLEKDINIVVTDLISAPIVNNSRPFLTCNQYSNEDAKELDDILKTKIERDGYKTRAGVVEAARFLTLEFPYRVNYFIETGRLNNYDKIDHVDGEGRYYHQGLYLSTEKYSTLSSSKNGPTMWGCDMQQGDGLIRQNGFDCSGFVTWVLYNGGFDVKDTGAGYTDRTDDVSDLGQSHSITMDFLKSGQIKAGDLIGSNGHAAIIAAIDDNNIYVAESLYYNTGVTILTYSFEELTRITKFSYISLMDGVYLSDGNYSAMWN